jgi:hypothetical protein
MKSRKPSKRQPSGPSPGCGYAVAIGELEHGRDAHRALEVDVQFDLGQDAQIPHDLDGIGRPSGRPLAAAAWAG